MHTVPMDRSNLGECAWIAEKAYGEGKDFNAWLRPNPTTFPDHVKHFFARHLRRMLSSPGHRLRVLVADDNDEGIADGTVIGFAAWMRSFGDEEKRDGTDQAATTTRSSNGGSSSSSDDVIWPERNSLADRFERWALGWIYAYHDWFQTDPGYDQEALSSLITSIGLIRGKLADFLSVYSSTGGYMYLNDLCIDPKYQRRGAGAKLLKQGMKLAEKENIPIALVASDTGNKLYKTSGFVVVGNESMRHNGHEIMVYWPEGTKPSNMKKFLVTNEGVKDTEELVQ